MKRETKPAPPPADIFTTTPPMQQSVDLSTRTRRRALAAYLRGGPRRWAVNGSLLWTAAFAVGAAWSSWIFPPMGVGLVSVLAWVKSTESDALSRIVNPSAGRRRTVAYPVAAFRLTTAYIAATGCGVAIVRAALFSYVPPADHVVGGSLVSVAQANALTITMGALITVALHNFITRPARKGRLRTVLGWILPVPAAIVFARVAPVGGVAAAATAGAAIVVYLASWFRPRRR